MADNDANTRECDRCEEVFPEHEGDYVDVVGTTEWLCPNCQKAKSESDETLQAFHERAAESASTDE